MTSKLLIYSYSACSTCKKAINWLNQYQLDFDVIDIVNEPPSKEILKKALNQVDARKDLFNTRGVSYRSMGSEVVRNMTNEEAIEALASDGKLIKRPFLVTASGLILLGFKSEVWEISLLK